MLKDKDTELSKYKKKSDREHILDNPDTYIGSVDLLESNEYNWSSLYLESINSLIVLVPSTTILLYLILFFLRANDFKNLI